MHLHMNTHRLHQAITGAFISVMVLPASVWTVKDGDVAVRPVAVPRTSPSSSSVKKKIPVAKVPQAVARVRSNDDV